MDDQGRRELRKKRRKAAVWIWIAMISIIGVALVLGSTYTYWAPAQVRLLQSVKVALGLKGDLRIDVVESSNNKSPVVDCAVAVDGRPAKQLDGGRFTARALSTGRHSVTVESQHYEKVKRVITVDKGTQHTLAIEVCLSAQEAARRWVKTKQENNHGATYAYLYPDERAKVSRADYIAYKSAVQREFAINIVSFTTAPAAMLKRWRHPDSGKVYSNVAKVRVSGIVAANDSGKTVRTWDVYAKKVDGRWLFFAAN